MKFLNQQLATIIAGGQARLISATAGLDGQAERGDGATK